MSVCVLHFAVAVKPKIISIVGTHTTLFDGNLFRVEQKLKKMYKKCLDIYRSEMCYTFFHFVWRLCVGTIWFLVRNFYFIFSHFVRGCDASPNYRLQIILNGCATNNPIRFTRFEHKQNDNNNTTNEMVIESCSLKIYDLLFFCWIHPFHFIAMMGQRFSLNNNQNGMLYNRFTTAIWLAVNGRVGKIQVLRIRYIEIRGRWYRFVPGNFYHCGTAGFNSLVDMSLWRARWNHCVFPINSVIVQTFSTCTCLALSKSFPTETKINGNDVENINDTNTRAHRKILSAKTIMSQ